MGVQDVDVGGVGVQGGEWYNYGVVLVLVCVGYFRDTVCMKYGDLCRGVGRCGERFICLFVLFCRGVISVFIFGCVASFVCKV